MALANYSNVEMLFESFRSLQKKESSSATTDGDMSSVARTCHSPSNGAQVSNMSQVSRKLTLSSPKILNLIVSSTDCFYEMVLC